MAKRKKWRLVVCLGFVCLIGRSGIACTAFCLSHGEQCIMGSNMDQPVWRSEFQPVRHRLALGGDERGRSGWMRPVSRGKGAHYFFCDRSGDAAVVEFINGRTLV